MINNTYRKKASYYADYYLDSERGFSAFSKLNRKKTKAIAETRSKEKAAIRKRIRASDKSELYEEIKSNIAS